MLTGFAALTLALQVAVVVRSDAHDTAKRVPATVDKTPKVEAPIEPTPLLILTPVPQPKPEPVKRRVRKVVERVVPPIKAAVQKPVQEVKQAAAGGALSRIAKCESGGNPRAVSPSGKYRGKYQFDQRTWNGVGGSGDPAAASEAEQDMRASMLYSQRGNSPWPNC